MAFTEDFKIYHPNKSGSGAASAWQLRVKNVERNDKVYTRINLFLVMAPQTGVDSEGNANFAWKDGSVTVLLGDLDVGEMLLVLRGAKKEVGTGKGLFHQNANGNSSINLSYNDKGILYLGVSVKKGSDAPVRVNHSVSPAEAAVLEILLTEFIKRKYMWSNFAD